jgi:hypothetical protein
MMCGLCRAERRQLRPLSAVIRRHLPPSAAGGQHVGNWQSAVSLRLRFFRPSPVHELQHQCAMASLMKLKCGFSLSALF